MEIVKLVDGTSLRIIEYTIISQNPDIGIKHLTNKADAMRYLEKGNCALTRIAQKEDGSAVTQTWHESAKTWYDENGIVFQETEEDQAVEEFLPVMHILKVHPGHLKSETRDLLDKWNMAVRTASPTLPYAGESQFIEGTAVATDKIIKEMPNDLIKILRFAKQHNCGMVLFTTQTEIIDALPLFNGESVQKPAELNLKTLKDAYKNANLTSVDFPAKLEVQYNFQPVDELMTELKTELFDAENPEQFTDSWTQFCMEQHIHPDTIRRIEKLCDL